MTFFQHGDVLIKSSCNIPKGLKKKGDKHLAEGEATGHFHLATAEDVILYEDENGNLWMDNPSGTNVIHQEHKEIYIPPGKYKIDIVKEYDHFEEEARKVID